MFIIFVVHNSEHRVSTKLWPVMIILNIKKIYVYVNALVRYLNLILMTNYRINIINGLNKSWPKFNKISQFGMILKPETLF